MLLLRCRRCRLDHLLLQGLRKRRHLLIWPLRRRLLWRRRHGARALDIRRSGRRYACTSRLAYRLVLLSVFKGSRPGGGFQPRLWGWGGAAVLLEELLGRVVFCGCFELVDCFGALELVFFEAAGGARDAVGVVGGDGGADEVHAGELLEGGFGRD